MCLQQRSLRHLYSGYAKKRKRIQIWTARKARWRLWRKFGVDWNFLEGKLKIIDIMRIKRRQKLSKQKCKINDAEKRPFRKLKVNNLNIHQQPGICVNPRFTVANGKKKMFKNFVRKFQVKRKASSKKTSSVTSNPCLFFFHSKIVER